MFNSFGPLEIVLLLVIVLVIFGPKRLPQLGRQMGRGMKEFKDSITGDSKDDEDEDAPQHQAALASAPEAPAAPVPPAPATPEPAVPPQRAPADIGAERRS